MKKIGYKSGFVSIIGRPNVGKSTLLNKLIGEKISIISDKAQTTRNKIQLVYTDEDCQIIFLDTPGIQMPKNELGEYMLKVSKSTLDEVDIILVMVEAGIEFGKLDKYIFKELENIDLPKILLINKIDLVDKDTIMRNLKTYGELGIFQEIIPLSAENDQDFLVIISKIRDLLEEGPMYYPADMITDQPVRLIIAEIIREKVLLNMSEEIPHGIAVQVEKIEQRSNRKLTDVYANINVEKKSHKPMIIGKSGKMIQKIGSEARKDIEKLMDTRVNLQLWVKIAKDWRDKEDAVRGFGYE